MSLVNKITEFRKDLHRIPELGFKEFKTSEYIKNALVNMGYDPISIAGTGVAVYIKGISNETIAFRADMDGLAVSEETGLDYKSIHDGMMHACGHDGHMAMLLGLANALKDYKGFNKSILLIFQPAEEGPGGAKVIIEEGILGKYNVTEIYGIHLYPGLEEGTIGSRPGPLMARSGEFDIEIKGKSSHAGLPHKGRDALMAGADLVADFNNIVSRNFNPIEPVVINVGIFKSEEA
ncbi:MAG: M20 family metallopeptidase, partial [Clostridiaceae bacterium]